MNTVAWRLYWFELKQGNRLALGVLAERLGWAAALKIAARLQWHLWRHSPFASLNAKRRPTLNERLSQHQMAPLILLHRLLLEEGLAEPEVLSLLTALSETVAMAFLQYNVPILRQQDFLRHTHAEKLRLLQRLTGRFFNAEAALSLVDDDTFRFDVQHCHFAWYSQALGVPQLAPLFCHADKRFFDEHQPDVVFFRSQTLAANQLPCDFRFTWVKGSEG
jgi:hypothetical protein